MSLLLPSKIIFQRYLVSNPDWWCGEVRNLAVLSLKGKVSRDFRLQVIFMNQFPPSQKQKSRDTVPLNWRRYDYLDEDYYSDELVDEEFIPEFVTKPTEYVVS